MRTSPNGVLAGAIRRAVFHGIACEEFGVYAGFIRSGGLAEKMSNTDDLAAAFATDEQAPTSPEVRSSPRAPAVTLLGHRRVHQR